VPVTDGSVLFVPETLLDSLPLRAMFPSAQPLEVDIGCGNGTFLAAMAARHPERNFIGIERLAGRVRKSCRRLQRQGLANVRVLRLETAYAVRHTLPAATVSVFHLAFPDPWPKRRHHRRRLVQPEFLDAVHRALEPGGEVRITTDDAPYFKWIETVCGERADFAQEAWEPGDDYPQTDFERIFRAQDLPIYRLLLRKT
jgi:tRNA (guanine-N7-)-methyltransferase